MITVDPNEYRDIMDVNMSLFYFAGFYDELIEKDVSFHDFLTKLQSSDHELLYKCRDTLFKNPGLINDYIQLNKANLTPSKLQIATDYKRHIKSTFVLYKSEADYGIFIDSVDNKVYAVKGLVQTFDELVPGYPVIVKAVILPFQNTIIYDGFFEIVGLVEEPKMLAFCHEIIRDEPINFSI